MTDQEFQQDVQTLYYALRAEKALKDKHIQIGQIQPTTAEEIAFAVLIGNQKFVVALTLDGEAYYTTNVV